MAVPTRADALNEAYGGLVDTTWPQKSLAVHSDRKSSMVRRERGTHDGFHGRATVLEVRDALGQFMYYEIELNGQLLDGPNYHITDPTALASAFLIAQEVAESGLETGPKPS